VNDAELAESLQSLRYAETISTKNLSAQARMDVGYDAGCDASGKPGAHCIDV